MEVEALTYDHRVPKWFLSRMSYFGFSKLKESKLRKHNIEMLRQMICVKCNTAKGGKIDWDDPLVKQFMFELVQAIMDKLNIL